MPCTIIVGGQWGDEAKGKIASYLALVEKPLLRAVLRETAGNQVRAAQILGINRNTLRKKLTEHGIDPEGLGG